MTSRTIWLEIDSLSNLSRYSRSREYNLRVWCRAVDKIGIAHRIVIKTHLGSDLHLDRLVTALDIFTFLLFKNYLDFPKSYYTLSPKLFYLKGL